MMVYFFKERGNNMSTENIKNIVQSFGRCLRTEKPQRGGIDGYSELAESLMMMNEENELEPENKFYDVLKEIAMLNSKEKLELVREFGRQEIDNGFIVLDKKIRILIYKMLSMIFKENNLKILNPFSGMGALIDDFVLNYPDSQIIIEEVNDEAAKLQKKLFGSLDINNVEVLNIDYLKEDVSKEVDLILSQPPIGVRVLPKNIGLLDWESSSHRIMDVGQAYLIKSIEKLRDGGILVGVLSPNILFSRTNQRLRNFLKEKMEILSIIETPKNIYNNYNRHAAIMIMRKKLSDKRQVDSIVMASFKEYNINSDEFKTEYEKLINVWDDYLKEEVHND